jgi:hypothetical protein
VTTIETTPTLEISKAYKCPVCGNEQHEGEGLEITIKEFQGSYCMKCYAKFLSKNIPKMIKK